MDKRADIARTMGSSVRQPGWLRAVVLAVLLAANACLATWASAGASGDGSGGATVADATPIVICAHGGLRTIWVGADDQRVDGGPVDGGPEPTSEHGPHCPDRLAAASFALIGARGDACSTPVVGVEDVAYAVTSHLAISSGDDRIVRNRGPPPRV
ncbi:MAG: hypothetical protein AAFR55_04200 [Pseudomonadota bacterium]